MTCCIHPCACGRKITLPALREGVINLSCIMQSTHNLELIFLEDQVRITGKCRGCNRPFLVLTLWVITTVAQKKPDTRQSA